MIQQLVENKGNVQVALKQSFDKLKLPHHLSSRFNILLKRPVQTILTNLNQQILDESTKANVQLKII